MIATNQSMIADRDAHDSCSLPAPIHRVPLMLVTQGDRKQIDFRALRREWNRYGAFYAFMVDG